MTIMHIDANSAYLSWTAVHMLEKGYPIDIRDIPSCIAGDPKNRHGIILAKSGPAKLWPLPVGELFMVGRATSKKLLAMNIRTVGDLANADVNMLKVLLKKIHGQLVWEYANGLDLTPVTKSSDLLQKSVGNSITIPYDVSTEKEAKEVLLALCERVGMRIRKLGCKASLISVHLKTSDFTGRGHQVQLSYHTDSTSDLYRVGWQLVEETWHHEPLRQMGISAGNFAPKDREQLSLFHPKDLEKDEQMNQAVDRIRGRYGDRAIIRGVFANTKVNAIQGGVNDGDFLMMGGYSL